MSNDTRIVEPGDRFEDSDPRQGRRVIRILSASTDHLSRLQYWYEVEVAEFNPKTIGHRRRLSDVTLRRRYTRISR